MGADISAIAGIGLRVDRDRLYVRRKAKIFEHDFSEEILFHPQTGRELWVMKNEPIDGYDEFQGTFAGYKVESGSNEEKLYILIDLADTGSNRRGGMDARSAIPAPEKIGKFMAMMVDEGLWNETEFGLWAVLRISI